MHRLTIAALTLLGTFVSGIADIEASGNGCSRKEECQDMPSNASCFGTILPYHSTSFKLTNSEHYWDVQARLQEWSALQFVPKCWAVVQPLLCSIYLPECHNQTIHLIQKQLCSVVKSQCRIVDSVSQLLKLFWPDFIDCENQQVFASDCEQNRRPVVRFNTAAKCLAPYLVVAKHPASYFEPIDDCGLNCKSPFFNDQEHESVSNFVFWGMLCGFLASLFAVLTFVIGGSWRAQPAANSTPSGRIGSINSYSNRVIFYMNVCYVFILIGIMAQFLSDKSSITCRSDGTRRISEPGLGENFNCVLVFVLVYYFSMACCAWSVILVYTWSLIFRRLGKVKADDKFEKRGAYFHIFAWSIPLILTIAILFMNGVDGDYLTGICFISQDSTLIAWFLLAPLAVTITANAFFTSIIFYSWFKATKTQVISENSASRIKATLVKIVALFVAPTSLLIISTIVHHIYLFSKTEEWHQSMQRFLICEAKKATSEIGELATPFSNKCEFKSKPSLLRIQLQLLCLFASAILVSSLVWTKATCRTWKRFVLRVLLKYCSLTSSNDRRKFEEEDCGKRHDVRIKKHELIAQAYSKRNQLKEQGRLSLSFHSQNEDPAAFDLESRQGKGQESEGFSSTWAAALPRLVQRRNGLVGAIELGLKRCNSVDSDLNLSRSVSIRSKRFSFDSSRRNSFVDSQFSVHQSELDHLQSLYKSRKSRRGSSFFKNRRGKLFSKRSNRVSGFESDATSQGSVASSFKVLPAITLDPAKLEEDRFKSRMTDNLPNVPPPGKSVDFSQKRTKFDSTEFIELQEKLRKLTNASKTSHETFISEEESLATPFKSTAADNLPTVLSPEDLNQKRTNSDLTKYEEKRTRKSGTFISKEPLASKSVQTSLTDLTGLQTRVDVKDASTQDDIRLYPSVSTTSSSQTESHQFIKHIDANVIKIRVPPSSEESSSIPSSYEGYRREVSRFVMPEVAPPLTKETVTKTHTPHHKRGRRGGLVEQKMLKSGGRTLNELELKARTPEQLQTLPDTIIAISTASS